MPDDPFLIDIVDDEELVRKALGRLIKSAGFDVRTFASGADFLRSSEERRPDCVILDIRMPHLDGFGVHEALLRDAQRTPVVIITGDDSLEYRSRAFRNGARAFLRKPVDDSMLLAAIEKALLPLSGPGA